MKFIAIAADAGELYALGEDGVVYYHGEIERPAGVSFETPARYGFLPVRNEGPWPST